MIPIEVLLLLPRAGGAVLSRARDLLVDLRSRLAATGRRPRDVLALTFFAAPGRPDRFGDRRAGLAALAADLLGPSPPPVGVVAQAPDGGRRVAIEATLLAASAAGDRPATRILRRGRGARARTVVEQDGIRQVHAAGICGGPGDDRAAQARAALAEMAAILEAEGLGFDHVVRQWTYIEGILEVGADGRQGYQIFNDARSEAFAGSRFPAGYPAATGIGQSAGGIVVDFLAIAGTGEVQVAALSNPRQVDAHRYSAGVLVGPAPAGSAGKAAPKFERAKLVTRGASASVFVSGTAAILGQRSAAAGDVRAQTELTIENIEAVAGKGGLTHLRAYVKREEEFPAVREVLTARFGEIPALYVKADVCRPELLVEIEGARLGAPSVAVPGWSEAAGSGRHP